MGQTGVPEGLGAEALKVRAHARGETPARSCGCGDDRISAGEFGAKPAVQLRRSGMSASAVPTATENGPAVAALRIQRLKEFYSCQIGDARRSHALIQGPLQIVIFWRAVSNPRRFRALRICIPSLPVRSGGRKRGEALRIPYSRELSALLQPHLRAPRVLQRGAVPAHREYRTLTRSSLSRGEPATLVTR